MRPFGFMISLSAVLHHQRRLLKGVFCPVLRRHSCQLSLVGPRVSHDVSESNSLGYACMPSVGTWHMPYPPKVIAHHYIGSPRSQERSQPNSIEEQYDKLDCSPPEPSLESAQLGAQVSWQAVSTMPSQSAPAVMPQLYGSTSSLPHAAASSRGRLLFDERVAKLAAESARPVRAPSVCSLSPKFAPRPLAYRSRRNLRQLEYDQTLIGEPGRGTI